MAKPAKPKTLLSPFMLTMAALAGWAAAHVPAALTPASLGVWVCGAVTAALLTRALLALVTPLVDIMGVFFGRALKSMQNSGADS